MELRALRLEDMEQIRQWRNSQLESLRTPHMLTKEMQDKFYTDVVCDRNARSRYWGVITSKRTGEYKFLNCPDYCSKYNSTLKDIDCKACEYKSISKDMLIGMAGLEDIQWENRLAEISLILNINNLEEFEEALRLILHEGFMNMNLENIFTEVYVCNPNYKFWEEQAKEWECITTGLPERKFHLDTYWNSIYINFNRSVCLEHIISKSS